jgi:hypothetical protein
MSDYNPGPGGPYDKYGNSNPNSAYEPVDPGGRGPYILLGILVAIGLIGGLLYFNGGPRNGHENTAQAPMATERPMTAPTPSASPAVPAAPATPAPSDSTK